MRRRIDFAEKKEATSPEWYPFIAEKGLVSQVPSGLEALHDVVFASGKRWR